MVQTLFEHFLEDENEFEGAVHHWTDLVDEVAKSLGQTGEWRRWISPYCADGKTLIDRDVMPIYDARSTRLNRAFRIQQHAALRGELTPVVGAWVESYGDEWSNDMPAAELFISVVLSKESSSIVRSLLKKWMTPSTSITEMQSFVHELGI